MNLTDWLFVASAAGTIAWLWVMLVKDPYGTHGRRKR